MDRTWASLGPFLSTLVYHCRLAWVKLDYVNNGLEVWEQEDAVRPEDSPMSRHVAVRVALQNQKAPGVIVFTDKRVVLTANILADNTVEFLYSGASTGPIYCLDGQYEPLARASFDAAVGRIVEDLAAAKKAMR